MNYRLVDSRLSFAVSEPVSLTPAEAVEANRDLYLAGHRAYGWIEASKIGKDGKLLPAGHLTPRPAPRPADNPDLVAALVAVGYSKSKAKELAGTAPAGTVDQQLAALFTKSA